MEREPELRYELDELVDKDDLVKLIESFSRSLSVAAGVVRHMKPDEEYPIDIKAFKKWRLTPTIGVDCQGKKINGGSRFCSTIRALDGGNKRCMKSDMTEALSAFYLKKAID